MTNPVTQDEYERAHEALLAIMRIADAMKEPCGSDPESEAAIRNGKFATLAGMAAQGLGLVRGPSLAAAFAERDAKAVPVTTIADCEIRLTELVGEYEWDDGENYHLPNEVENALLMDFANGLFSDEKFMALLRSTFATPPPSPQQAPINEPCSSKVEHAQIGGDAGSNPATVPQQQQAPSEEAADLPKLRDFLIANDATTEQVSKAFTEPSAPRSAVSEAFGRAIERSLASYHCQYTAEADGEIGLTLADMLTPPNEPSITDGIEEVKLLADHLYRDLESFAASRQAADEGIIRLLNEAPILSKYHGQRGFEVDRFIADYDEWRAAIVSQEKPR